jgi:hypothetical protein
MILMVSAWDMDAMRPHIAAHSWYTLAFVALFLIVHVSDYLTVGQLVTRLDPLLDPFFDPLFAPLALADANAMVAAANDAGLKGKWIGLPGLLSQKQPSPYSWRSFFPPRQPQLALNLNHPTDQPTAKLYTFTAVTTTVAQASGAPYPITQQHYVVKPE